MEKRAEVRVNVPYRGAGNIIRQKEVSFEVFLDGVQYTLVPVLSEAERRVANLPERLEFNMIEGKPVSSRGPKDGNFHVIQDAVDRLSEMQLL